MSETKVIELSNVSIYQTKSEYRSYLFRRRPAKGDLVLSNINLSVTSGELVYLIGRVGSGKSTLLKILYGEIPLLEGHGGVVGYDLRRLSRKQIPYLRRSLGIVYQDYQLLPDRNVVNNLMYVMKATGWRVEIDMKRKIEEVLNRVGLKNKEYKMIFELSGGEQQRLAIARALINDPNVILADEPTGNLDPAAADDIMHLFKSIADSGCAILMATHNISNIQLYPSRTLRFSNGRVEEVDVKSFLGIQK